MNTWGFAFGWVFAWAILGGLIIVAVEALITSRKRHRLIDAGIYPKPGTETEEDVRKLLAAGHQDMAIRCYRTIHRVNFQQARDKLLGEGAGKRPGYSGIPFIGMVLGLSVGVAIKNVGFGMLIGLALGFALTGFLKRRRSAGS